MNGEKQYVNLKLGKIYRFASYYWTICELDKAHNTAVLQSHGVTGGAWPGFKMEKFGNSDYYVNSIDGQDISGYDDKMQSLYDIIKEVEDTSATYGKGLYLISMEKDGFTGWAAPGSGNYWQAMKTAAKNFRSFGAAYSDGAWFGNVVDSKNAWYVHSNGSIYGSYQENNFVVAPAFNLDLSKVEIVDDEIVIKGRSYDNTNTDKSLIVEKNVKKARLILAVTEQVSENNFERHYKTVEIEVPESANLADYDIIGGEWIS